MNHPSLYCFDIRRFTWTTVSPYKSESWMRGHPFGYFSNFNSYPAQTSISFSYSNNIFIRFEGKEQFWFISRFRMHWRQIHFQKFLADPALLQELRSKLFVSSAMRVPFMHLSLTSYLMDISWDYLSPSSPSKMDASMLFRLILHYAGTFEGLLHITVLSLILMR